MATECTQEAVLEFLIERGGRVKNKELIDHFKVFLSSEQSKRTLLKETFKRFVDNVAYVKQENGEKIVCLKKKYRDQEMRTGVADDGKCNGNGHLATGISKSEQSERTAVNGAIQDQNNGVNPLQMKEHTENTINNSTFNLNTAVSSVGNESYLGRLAGKDDAEQKARQAGVSIDTSKGSKSSTDDENMSNNTFDLPEGDLCISHVALVEVTNLSADADLSEHSNFKETSGQVSTNEMTSDEVEHSKTVETASTHVQSTGNLGSVAGVEADLVVIGKGMLATQIINRRRTSRGSQRSLLSMSEGGLNEGQFDSVSISSGDGNTPKSSRKNFIELMMNSSPQVRRTLVHRNSQSHMSVRNRDSIKSESDLTSLDEDCASVTLDPLEHEWMMCASDGQWESLQRLLACEPNLVIKKDFVTGFTCLHWAAKQGNQELFAMLVSFAKQHAIPINVNARSSAGYTPLHLAAMHNHVEVMKLLVGAYDADVDMRDYSGKKASQYLSNTVTGDIKDIIGAHGDSDTENVESGAGRWRLPKVLPSNLNPLRLLNHPEEATSDNSGLVKSISLYRKSSIGRIRLNRARFKTQIVHSTSFRGTEEGDGPLKSPVKSRPVSNLFG